MDEATYIGAITRRPQLDVLQAPGRRRQTQGRSLLTGGASIKRKGNWFAPTVLDRRRSLDGA